MADQKITELTELTAPIGTDIIPIVDDPGGTPITKKVTLNNIFKAMEGAAKFWATVTGAGSPSLAASFNVTSVADTNTGRMTITIATDFASANWALSVGGIGNTTVTSAAIQWGVSKAAGSIELDNSDLSATPVVEDPAVGYDAVGFGAQ